MDSDLEANGQRDMGNYSKGQTFGWTYWTRRRKGEKNRKAFGQVNIRNYGYNDTGPDRQTLKQMISRIDYITGNTK